MRFDHLRDAPPDAVERLLTIWSAREMRGMVGLGLLALTIIFGVWGFEHYQLLKWRKEFARIQQRFDTSREALAAMRSRLRNLHALVEFDTHLRRIRLSGASSAKSVATLANQLPPNVWLTSMLSTDSGYDISGHALSLAAIGDTLDAYRGTESSRLVSVRTPVEPNVRIIDFQVHVTVP